MALGLRSERESRVMRLGKGERLVAIERIFVLAIIGTILVVDVVGLFLPSEAGLLDTAIGIASTAVLALYLWSPLYATCALALVFALSFLTGTEAYVLTAAAFAAGLIMRLGWNSLILSYAGLFLLATSLVAMVDTDDPINIAIYLVTAAVSGAVGFALRAAFARGSRLEQQLAEKAEQERQAVLAERRWIAGELHDSIAHHLTVVSLHVQMLDDDRTSSDSQEAIRIAARKAMTDLRFVIDLADDGPRSEGMPSGDLAASIDEAKEEFESAGHSVALSGDPTDERIPRAAEIILARIMRESATNVLKYAGRGEVEIRLEVDDDVVGMTISSPLSVTPRRELSSSRTGIGRMAERVLGASGEFDAGEVDGRWVVSARLPLVRALETRAEQSRKQ